MTTEFDASPKYLQIRQILLRWLKTVNIGSRLPTEQELSKRFGVSRVTVRQALDTLIADGTIARRPGYGTWLNRKIASEGDQRLTGHIEEVSQLAGHSSTALISRGVVIATDEVREALKLARDEKVFLIERVRFWDGMPLLLLQAFFPLVVGKKIKPEELGDGLMVPVLKRLIDPQIFEVDQRIEAITADKQMADALKVPVKSAILNIKRNYVTSTLQPVVYFRTLYRADRYYYTVNMPQSKQGSVS